MRVTIWGCRGSVATPGPETVEFGGNTSCVEVSLADGTVLVLDAGTGIRELGIELFERGARKLNVLLTHLHLDHLEGLRFFGPLFDERVDAGHLGTAVDGAEPRGTRQALLLASALSDRPSRSSRSSAVP